MAKIAAVNRSKNAFAINKEGSPEIPSVNVQFTHSKTAQTMQLSAPLDSVLQHCLTVLRSNKSKHN